LIDYLNDGYTIEDFVELFPSVAKGEVETFLRLIESNSDEDHFLRKRAMAASSTDRSAYCFGSPECTTGLLYDSGIVRKVY